MKNIIIRTPNFIGDTINATPAIELLKQEYPDAQFTIVGPSFIKDLFKHDGRITNYIFCDQRNATSQLKLLQAIRKHKYDIGVLFVNTFISALIFKLACVKKIIGYDNEKRGALLDFKLHLNRNTHYINHYASLVNKFLGDKYTYLPPLSITYTGQAPFQFSNTKKTIGLYLGGVNKGFRRYPEQEAVQLLKQLQDYNIVLIGDNNDNQSHEDYLEKSHHPHAINLTGKTSIEEFINTIANLDLLITIDSSAMHIAAATKTKFIALMGLSTSPTSAITPKVEFGKVFKIENNMINEEDYIKNITPEIIIDEVRAILPIIHSEQE